MSVDLRGKVGNLLAGSALCSMCGVLYAWSIFVLPLEQLFGWQRSETAFTFTVMIVCFSLGMFAGGRLLERHSPFRTVLTGGLLLCAGFLGAAQASSLAGLYLCYGGLAGFGVGIVNLVPAAVCLRWYPHQRGLVSGLLTLALALGTLLFGTVFSGVLIERLGVQTTFQVLAAAFLAIVLLCAGFLRFPPRGTAPAHGAAASSAGGPEAHGNEPGLALTEMLKTSTYWMIWGWMFVVQTGGLMIIGHIVPYAQETGLSSGEAALAMGIYAAANGAGRLAFGYAHDRFGRTAGMLFGAGCMGTGLLALALLPPLAGMAGFVLAAVLVAMAYGGTIPQLSALVMVFFGPRHFGVNYGFSTTPLMAASLSGPFLGGLIRAESGDYLPALYAAAALTLLGLLPAALLRKAQPFWK